MIGMGKLTLDFVRGNRASTVTIAATVGISAFLLALLMCVLFNFWTDAATQAAADGIAWQEQLGGELMVTAALYGVVVALACIALVLIIRNAFLASMQNRVHQLGILATVGATPRQLRSMLTRDAFALSIVPALAGIVLGTLAAAGFITTIAGLSQDLGLRGASAGHFAWHPLLLAAIAVVVLATVMVSAGSPARKLAKTTPLMAITGIPEKSTKRQARPGLIARAFGAEGRLAAASMGQRKVALRSTFIALAFSFLALGLFLSFMTVSKMSVDDTYYQRFGIAWDAAVDATADKQPALEALERGLQGVAEQTRMDTSDKGVRLYVKYADAPATAIANLQKAIASIDAASNGSIGVVDMAKDKQRADAIWTGYSLAVGGFCAILALIGLAAVLAQAVGFIHQRKREFARLRSIGLTPGGVYKMLAAEGVLTVARPLCFALPLVILGAIVLTWLGRQPLEQFALCFPYGVVLGYLALMLALVLLAYFLGARRIARSPLAEALKDDTLL